MAEVLRIALDRSVEEMEKVLDDAARQGRGKVVELRKAQGICQALQRKTESLQEQQVLARQLKQNLRDLASTMLPSDRSQEVGESTENDIQNRADQVFQVFDELTPVLEFTSIAATHPPVTNLSGLGPELVAHIKLEISKTLDSERKRNFADHAEQGRQTLQRNQPSCDSAQGFQHGVPASSEPQFDDAASLRG